MTPWNQVGKVRDRKRSDMEKRITRTHQRLQGSATPTDRAPRSSRGRARTRWFRPASARSRNRCRPAASTPAGLSFVSWIARLPPMYPDDRKRISSSSLQSGIWKLKSLPASCRCAHRYLAGVGVEPDTGLPGEDHRAVPLPPVVRDVHLLGNDDGGGRKESGSGNGQETSSAFHRHEARQIARLVHFRAIRLGQVCHPHDFGW